jgi:acetyltransferase
MTLRHYLRPLVAPSSVALVGASERAGSLGRIVYENMLAGGVHGEIVAVNPNHKQVLGQPALRSLAALQKPVDLAASPRRASTSPGSRGRRGGGLKAVVILTASPAAVAARKWEREILAVTANTDPFLGTAAFGVIRTDLD